MKQQQKNKLVLKINWGTESVLINLDFSPTEFQHNFKNQVLWINEKDSLRCA